MKEMKCGTMPNGTVIQIESNLCSSRVTLAAFPESKASVRHVKHGLGSGYMHPAAGKPFRLAMLFPDMSAAEAAFKKLESGEKKLIDYAKFFVPIEGVEDWQLCSCVMDA